MCINQEKLENLCNLFPQTAENLKSKAKERRAHFMKRRTEYVKKLQVKNIKVPEVKFE